GIGVVRLDVADAQDSPGNDGRVADGITVGVCRQRDCVSLGVHDGYSAVPTLRTPLSFQIPGAATFCVGRSPSRSSRVLVASSSCVAPTPPPLIASSSEPLISSVTSSGSVTT